MVWNKEHSFLQEKLACRTDCLKKKLAENMELSVRAEEQAERDFHKDSFEQKLVWSREQSLMEEERAEANFHMESLEEKLASSKEPSELEEESAYHRDSFEQKLVLSRERSVLVALEQKERVSCRLEHFERVWGLCMMVC